MSSKITVKTTFEVARSIQPTYTGGEISSNATGSLIATSVDDEILVVEVSSGRPLVRIDGDGESVTNLCLSPDQSHLVICSRSLSMRIYRLAVDGQSLSAELLRTLKPHNTPVISSVIDSTGSLLVTGGADGIAKVWDIRGGYCSHTFHGHGGLVTALAIFEAQGSAQSRKSSVNRKRKSRDGEDVVTSDAQSTNTILLASGGEDGKVKVWDLNTQKAIATLDSHVSVVRSLRYCQQRKQLLSASRDRTIVIWDAQSWSAQRIIPVLETLEAARFLSSGRYCCSGGEHGRLRLWDTETGKEVTSKQSPGLETEAIVALVDVQSEEAILSIHQDQTMALRSYKGVDGLASGKSIPPLPVLRRISGNHDEIIDMACIGPERSHLAIATNTESIKVISLEDDKASSATFGSDVALLEGHQDIIICLDVDWSGHWLATGAKDNTARLWRLDPSSGSYSCFAVFSGHAESLGAIALPKSLQPGSPATKDPLRYAPPFVLTGSQDKTIKKWDTSKLAIQKDSDEPHQVNKAVYTRVAHERDINALDVSLIAPLFASASQDRTIKIWSIEDGSTVGVLRGHKRGVWSVAFSPAGTPSINVADGNSSNSRGLLVSGSGDRTVKIWSLSSYTCLLTLEGHSNSVLKVMWLPPPPPPVPTRESDTLASTQKHAQTHPIVVSASSDTLIKLWAPFTPADSDHLLTTLDNHTDRIWSLAAPTLQSSSTTPIKPSSTSSPTYTFISGAADATLTFWRDTTTATLLHQTTQRATRIEQDQQLSNHIASRNYRAAITLALTLNHPARLLKILTDVITLPNSQKEPHTTTGSKLVDDVLGSLGHFELYRLLERVRDWNTNARTSVVAQRVLNVLFRSYPAATWAEMARNQRRFLTPSSPDTPNEGTETASTSLKDKKKQMGMRDLFRALEVYTERHYKRVEELVDESYLVEFSLREMDEVVGTNGVGAVGGGGGRGEVNGVHGRDGRVGDEDGEEEEDVIMV